MAVTHDTGPRVLCGIAVALLSVGCGLETMPRTGLAEQQNLTVVGSELRIRVRALAGPYVGAIEEAADDAAQRCRDPAIRVQALEWKLGSIPQAQDALLQADPLVALLDGWAYAVQMQRYLEGPAGRAALGECAGDAAAMMARVAARGKEIVEALVPGRGDATASLVEAWVNEHPLRALHLPRATIAPALASRSARKQLGALEAVGSVVETLDDLTARIAAYRESLLKEARWTAELAATHAVTSDLAAQTTRDVGRLSGAAERLGALAAALPSLVARERTAALDAVRAERVAVLAEIDAQRAETLALLQSERDVTLDRIDAMGRAAIDAAGARAEQLVDRVFLRIAELAVALLLAAGLIFLVVNRVLRARTRRRVAGPA